MKNRQRYNESSNRWSISCLYPCSIRVSSVAKVAMLSGMSARQFAVLFLLWLVGSRQWRWGRCFDWLGTREVHAEPVVGVETNLAAIDYRLAACVFVADFDGVKVALARLQ